MAAITIYDPTSGTMVNPVVSSVNTSNQTGVLSLQPVIGGTVVSNTNPIPILDGYQTPVTTSWTSASTLNTAQTINVLGYDTVVLTFTFTGSTTGGVSTFEVYDGASWVAIKGARAESYQSDSTYTLVSANGSRAWQFSVAGFQQFRTRISTVISGTGTVNVTHIVSSAPDVSQVTAGLDPSQPLPAGTNQLGFVSSSAASTGGSSPYSYIGATATNQDSISIKTSAGTLYSLNPNNVAAAGRWLKIYDKATAPTSADTPKLRFYLPAGSAPVIAIPSCGVVFTLGIAFRMTVGQADADTASITAGDVTINASYA